MLSLANLHYDPSGFSWILVSDRTNVVQVRYRVQAALESDFGKPIWDTGDVDSNRSVYAPDTGLALPPCETLYWRARVMDNHGDDSGWSEPQRMITGPAQKDWHAVFITPDTEADAAFSKGKLLRTSFDLDGDVQRATVYATALGLYELHFNGQRVGDALLTPGWTEYNKRLLYQTWDVTSMLQRGRNAVGAVLGAGWYKGDLASWTNQRSVYGTKTALLMKLDIHFTNGRKQTVVTGSGWKCSDGPIRFSELYHGETYDARLEKPGWNEAIYDDSEWVDAAILHHDLPRLEPQGGPLIRRQEIVPVKTLFTTPKGETILDFGQNLVGWMKFTVSGKPGDVVRLLHAEALDRDGNFYANNMRSAKNEILYALKGGGDEVFEPHFTFQGFRYVCVAEWPGERSPEHFQAVVIHSDMKPVGEFASSHKLLNQLHHNILWSMKGNFLDVPTDCPQRDERLGWTGDAQVFARTSTYLMDTREFFIKWLRDLREAQFENGGVPFVVPDVLTGKFPEGDIIANAESIAGWGDAAVICPWTLWLAYGDLHALGECYASMKAWVEYIRARATDGLLWNNDYQLGDWVALDAKEGSYFGATATDLIATAYYAKCAEILSRTAELLGYEEDAVFYNALWNNVKKAYADEFFSLNGRLVSPTQTAHILSLAFGITPEKYKGRTVQGLLKLLAENGGRLTTGFLGTPYFCQVLADHGCLEDAYKLLLKEEYPSWLYQIMKGATTIWEHWDGIKPDGSMWSANMNSFNHYAYGSVGEFLYRVIGGIDTDLVRTGYKHIIMRPRPGGGLTHARVSLVTPYGRAALSWRIEDGNFIAAATVPHNSTAAITLPDHTTYQIGSGDYAFSCKLTHANDENL